MHKLHMVLAVLAVQSLLSIPAMAAERPELGQQLEPVAMRPGGDAEAQVETDLPRSPQFGRYGELTEREMQMARVAWSYFEKYYQPETGLVNSGCVAHVRVVDVVD